MIKGIVFDFGGVMSRRPVQADMQPALNEVGLSWGALLRGFDAYRQLFDGGRINCQEMYVRIFTDNEIRFDGALLDKFFRIDSASWAHHNPGTSEWMNELKLRGFKIGILTNMSAQFAAEYFTDKFKDELALADAVVISAHENMVKPDSPIYKIMADRIGLLPEELIFIDDTAHNIDAACRLGWHGILFSDISKARADVERVIAADAEGGQK